MHTAHIQMNEHNMQPQYHTYANMTDSEVNPAYITLPQGGIHGTWIFVWIFLSLCRLHRFLNHSTGAHFHQLSASA